MRNFRFVFAIMLVIALSAPALAEIRPGVFSVSPFVGGFWFEGNQDLKHRPVYGLRLGYDFTKNWGAEAVFDYIDTKYKTTDTNIYNYRVEGLYHFMPYGKLVPFLAVGAGGMTINYRDDTANKTRAIFDYGAGLKYFFTDWLARLVGKSTAAELLLTGKTITADEALQIGLVNKVFAQNKLMEECEAFAGTIADKSPVAVKFILNALNKGLETDVHTGLFIEMLSASLCFSSEDCKKGLAALLDKKKPS